MNINIPALPMVIISHVQKFRTMDEWCGVNVRIVLPQMPSVDIHNVGEVIQDKSQTGTLPFFFICGLDLFKARSSPVEIKSKSLVGDDKIENSAILQACMHVQEPPGQVRHMF